MSFEHEFEDLFPNRVSIEPWAGQDTYGAPVYGAARTFPCRVSGKALALRRPTEEGKTPIFDIWLNAGDVMISDLDRVTIVGTDTRWSGQGTLVLFAVGVYTDPDGVHHTKLQCGWMYHRQGQ